MTDKSCAPVNFTINEKIYDLMEVDVLENDFTNSDANSAESSKSFDLFFETLPGVLSRLSALFIFIDKRYLKGEVFTLSGD